jgi:glutathione S-transferase
VISESKRGIHPGRTPEVEATRDSVLVTMWEGRMELEGFAAVMETIRNKVPGLKARAISGVHAYDRISGLVDRGLQRIANFYADLEARLAEGPFVPGARFRVADITASSRSIWQPGHWTLASRRAMAPRAAALRPQTALLPQAKTAVQPELLIQSRMPILRLTNAPLE